MANLQDIFNLAKADGGKFFVMDETGEPKLVIMDIEEYQKLLLGRIANTVQEVEQVNHAIMRAQLDDVVTEMPQAQPLSNTAIKNQQNNHHRVPETPEEAIDPSFDFEGPKFGIEDL